MKIIRVLCAENKLLESKGEERVSAQGRILKKKNQRIERRREDDSQAEEEF